MGPRSMVPLSLTGDDANNVKTAGLKLPAEIYGMAESPIPKVSKRWLIWKSSPATSLLLKAGAPLHLGSRLAGINSMKAVLRTSLVVGITCIV